MGEGCRAPTLNRMKNIRDKERGELDLEGASAVEGKGLERCADTGPSMTRG